MRKKTQMEIYKQGMKDGAEPFEEKFQETGKAIRKANEHMYEIAKNQRKEQNIVNTLIDGAQKNQQQIRELNKDVKENKKECSENRRKLQNMELIMLHVTSVCKSCGKPVGENQLVCSCCGEISKSAQYVLKDFNIEERCIEEVKELSEIIKASNNKEDDWLYPELDNKFCKMKKIQNIAYKVMQDKGKENAAQYKEIYECTQKFFAEYRKKRIEIAIVGTVKAGKSSLINALLGRKLASVDATPETSTLIKYRTTERDNYLKISFYTESEWKKLWNTTERAWIFREEYSRLNAEEIKDEYLNKRQKYIQCSSEELPDVIMEWSKSDEPKHFFVKEIEVGYQSESIPHDVFLVDTPGLSDPVSYRSNITRHYIKKSDWILACITGESLSCQPEFSFLSKVIANKGGDVSKVFVVATKKDMLTNLEGEKKEKEFLNRLGELYGNESMAISRFAFIAAEVHLWTNLIMRGIELEKEEKKKFKKALLEIDEDFEISDINRKSDVILNYAGVNDLFKRINDVVLVDRRKYILERITDDYNQCMRIINEKASSCLDKNMEYLSQLSEDREDDKKQIEKLIECIHDIEVLEQKLKRIRSDLEIQIEANI